MEHTLKPIKSLLPQSNVMYMDVFEAITKCPATLQMPFKLPKQLADHHFFSQQGTIMNSHDDQQTNLSTFDAQEICAPCQIKSPPLLSITSCGVKYILLTKKATPLNINSAGL